MGVGHFQRTSGQRSVRPVTPLAVFMNYSSASPSSSLSHSRFLILFYLKSHTMRQANGHMDGVERREILAHFLVQPAHAVAVGCLEMTAIVVVGAVEAVVPGRMKTLVGVSELGLRQVWVSSQQSRRI